MRISIDIPRVTAGGKVSAQDILFPTWALLRQDFLRGSLAHYVCTRRLPGRRDLNQSRADMPARRHQWAFEGPL